jgi:hypothetical protein
MVVIVMTTTVQVTVGIATLPPKQILKGEE